MNRETVPLTPSLRCLSFGDLDRIMQIEASAYPFPWSRGIFSDCIRVGYECHGLEVNGLLIGYSVQTCAAGESHLLNLCVAPDWQRRGFGALLLEAALRRARAKGCASVFLEVRPSNQAGIELYRNRGFRITGRRPAYYRAASGREDALLMQIDLGAPPGASLRAMPRHDPF